MSLDPVIGYVLAMSLALLLASASIDKWRHREEFAALLENYRILPGVLLPAASALIPVVEALVAAGLLIPVARPAAAIAGSCLLLGYALAMAVNLRRGRRDLDCGCTFGAARQSVSGALVVRNLVLAACALILVLPFGSRAMSWLDGAAVAFGVLAASLGWLALKTLLSNVMFRWEPVE